MTQLVPCVLVTGGAGFIGSNFVLSMVSRGLARVVNLDKLTYAGSLDNLSSLDGNPDHVFVHGDIGDRPLVTRLLEEHRPAALVNFAAESHVNRSIDAPGDFIQTNVVGTFQLLVASLEYVRSLPSDEAARFRFVQVSTDEVYGSIGPTGSFTEDSRYAPSSPYAASKAGADHLVRVYHETYGLPTITTNCSNNYGPRQLPEKLIPVIILSALEGRPLPVYGDGQHVRDWLYVGDHCEALRLVLARGRPGETYNIGGANEWNNLGIVELICDHLDELVPPANNRVLAGKAIGCYRELVTFVPDRPAHDRRYAVDASKIRRELGWEPACSFEDGIRQTVQWYLDHRAWCARTTRGAYHRQGLELGHARTLR